MLVTIGANVPLKLSININNQIYSQNKLVHLGETEELPNGNDMNFSRSICTEFFFETKQVLRIDVISAGNTIEFFELPLAAITGNSSQKCSISNENKNNLTVFAISNEKGDKCTLIQCSFTLETSKKDEYFYVLHTKSDDQQWRKYFKSDESTGSLVNFPVVSFPFDSFSGCSPNRPFSLELYTGNGFKVGFFVGTLAEIAGKKVKLTTENKDDLYISLQYTTKERANLQTFLSKGLDISLSVAIDFTFSNKPRDDPASLHFFNEYQLSPYQHAIMTCGSLLSYYDSDNSYPVVGFGAEFGMPPAVSHCFPLNLNQSQWNISGVDGIMQAYCNVFNFIQLSGPTFFRFFLDALFGIARKNKEKSPKTYVVMLILTDGAITDLKETKRLIADNSDLPVSIVIIGLGDDSFKSMEELDADKAKLIRTDGQEAMRDLVQFVQFEKFKYDSNELAKEMLKEIPYQIEEYYTNYSTAFN